MIDEEFVRMANDALKEQLEEIEEGFAPGIRALSILDVGLCTGMKPEEFDPPLNEKETEFYNDCKAERDDYKRRGIDIEWQIPFI